MRTIALRLTGTKSAKEELEEMGEETENVITTQSKLRDTIKEATAVASNEFKGFDILDENGNYKSTYEIMLGIADVYNEILETDKQFGRNNANLLLESVAGKNRANIAASIFQNPQLLRDAYQSSQEANGSAMRENDKYIQSISGHLAQLTNAWQQMWANAANRDVINFFIDMAKAVVNFANAIGVIPSTLLLLTPYLEIISRARSKDGKGLISQFLDWANGLNEAKKAAEGMTEVQKGLNEATEAGTAINATATISTEVKTVADIEGTAASVDKTIADEAQAASTLEVAGAEVVETIAQEASTKADIEGTAASAAKTAANAAEAGSSAAVGATGIARLTGAFSGLVSVIGIAPIAIGAAVVALMGLHKAYKDYEESLFTGAKELTNSLQSQQDIMTQQIESYTNLKGQLDSGNLSEQETINVKQQILDIQKSITDQYGSAAQGVNLINGELKEQIDLLNTITQKEAANQYWTEYKGFQVAEKQYNKNDRRYSFNILKSNNLDLNKAIENEFTKAGLSSEGFGTGTINAVIKGTASESVKELEKVKESLNDLKKEYRDPDAIKAIDKQIAEVEGQISKAYETIEKYEATALKGWELDLAANNTTGYDIYKNYQSSVSNLEDAYISGNTQKINEARKAFIEATKAKNDFLRIEDNGQFSVLFNSIDTSLVDVKNKFRDAVELFKDIPNSEEDGLFEKDGEKVYKKNSKALNRLTKNEQKAYKAAKLLYDLNPDRVDIEATLNDNSYATRKYADALNNLMNALGWTTKDANTLIDALIAAGIVQGNAADIGNIASDSYNNFSSSVETAITALNTLNSVLTESASGKGISNQTLEEFRKAFGEEAYQNLEKTANGYHLNVEQAYLLRQQQEALVKNDYSSALNEQYTALDRLREGYEKAVLTGGDTRGFVEQEKAIRNNIQALQDEMMSFNNANSAYQTWLAKQNSEGEREMYNSVYSGYDAVKDELERGWAGEKSRSWIDLIFNDENEDWDAWTAPAEKINEMFKQVKKKIKGTGGFSIADFFTVDANGKTTSEGVWNFFEAIQNKQKEVDKEFVKIGKDGEKIFDFGENGDYQIADLLGMDIESVHAILRAAADAGFEIHLDQPLFSMDELITKAEKAKKALEEMEGGELNINFNPESIEEASEDMAKLQDYKERILKDNSIEPKVKTQKLEYLNSIMELLAARERELSETEIFNFKALDEADQKINKLLSSPIFVKGLSEIDLTPEGLDTVEEIRNAYQYISELRASPDISSEQADYLDQLLQAIIEKLHIINEEQPEGNGLTYSAWSQGLEIIDKYNEAVKKANESGVSASIDWENDEEFMSMINWLDGLNEGQKYALGIDPDTNTEQLIDMAKNGIQLEVKTNKGKEQVKQELSSEKIETTTKITKEETNSYINQQLNTIDLGKETREEAIKESEEFNGNTYTATLDGDNSPLMQKEKESEDAVNKVGAMEAVPSVTLSGVSQVISGAETIKGQIASIRGKTIEVVANFVSNGLSNLKSRIQSVIDKANELSSKNYSANFANGTAHARGTAFVKGSIVSKHAYAGGKWGLPNDQTALTGELGTEIVVRDGNWFTIGEDGAEFVNLKKGDINKIVSIYSDVYIINHLIAGNP